MYLISSVFCRLSDQLKSLFNLFIGHCMRMLCQVLTANNSPDGGMLLLLLLLFEYELLSQVFKYYFKLEDSKVI